MKFYTFADYENPVILLISGTCCHWTIFSDVIPLLQGLVWSASMNDQSQPIGRTKAVRRRNDLLFEKLTMIFSRQKNTRENMPWPPSEHGGESILNRRNAA
ncbi:MAG: hypothetical protein PUJ06_08330 [Stecheria intestinalis]|nr:hypothetical protein [Stecheria intestinalis]MDY4681961.1 hypothetical protein [Lachnospiraceae bacterium]